MGLAGIDTKLFKAHSTRSASSTKALVSGLSLQEVLDRGNWSGESVLQKHYHKFVETAPARYQSHVVKDALNRGGVRPEDRTW